MSLKAKIEAVLYAADDPVTLVQLAALFGDEALATGQREESFVFETAGEESVESDESGVPGSVLGESQESKTSSDIDPPALPIDDEEAKQQLRLREREAKTAVGKIVEELVAEYSGSDRGMEIREIAGGYRITTRAEYHDAVRQFVKNLKPQMKLSLQALETLAVVAYKQPITAPEISEIRGVDTSGVLGGLMARKLIATAGRKPVIGRPILYKTTKEFLLRFGLKDVRELPSMEEFEKMAADLAGEMEVESKPAEVENGDTPASGASHPAGESAADTEDRGSEVELPVESSDGDSAEPSDELAKPIS